MEKYRFWSRYHHTHTHSFNHPNAYKVTFCKNTHFRLKLNVINVCVCVSMMKCSTFWSMATCAWSFARYENEKSRWLRLCRSEYESLKASTRSPNQSDAIFLFMSTAESISTVVPWQSIYKIFKSQYHKLIASMRFASERCIQLTIELWSVKIN